MNVLANEPMSKHTSFKVGGPAKYFVDVVTKDDLFSALDFVKEKGLPHFVVGNGTNLLVSDKGFDGIIIQLGNAFNDVEDFGYGNLHVGAAVSLARFARTCVNKGLCGVHKLSGIPGSVGGAIYMNAGAYGQEISQVCSKVLSVTMSGEIVERENKDCDFDYRHSIFQDLAAKGEPEVIVAADFSLGMADSRKDIDSMENEMRETLKKRAASQPLTMPNAGSVFKRLAVGAESMPEQIAPGYYIEQAGLKGFRIGGAEVSQVHANFIVNADNATASDILALSEHVQKTVAEKFGVELKREVILLGEI